MDSRANLSGTGFILEPDAPMGSPLKKPAVGYVHGTSPKLPGKADSETILGASPLVVKGK